MLKIPLLVVWNEPKSDGEEGFFHARAGCYFRKGKRYWHDYATGESRAEAVLRLKEIVEKTLNREVEFDIRCPFPIEILRPEPFGERYHARAITFSRHIRAEGPSQEDADYRLLDMMQLVHDNRPFREMNDGDVYEDSSAN